MPPINELALLANPLDKLRIVVDDGVKLFGNGSTRRPRFFLALVFRVRRLVRSAQIAVCGDQLTDTLLHTFP